MTITLPITEQAFWGIITLLGLIATSLVIAFILPKSGSTERAKVKLKDLLGLEDLPDWLYIPFFILWAILAVHLIFGLMWLLLTTFRLDYPLSWNLIARWDFGFHIAQVAAFAAVLGAVIALPVTLTRLRLARESNTLAKDSLFNDKITEAAADLYAQRQVSRQEGGRFVNVWEDDIVRRNAAIDRLFGLVEERPSEVNRVSRLLSVYLRELSREYPAIPIPSDMAPDDLRDWAYTLTAARSDMENAAQVLGRLAKEITGVPHKDLSIDLSHCNLQGMRLHSLNFDGVDLRNAGLSGATFSGSTIQNSIFNGANMCGTSLESCDLTSANFVDVDLRASSLNRADLSHSTFRDCKLTRVDFESAILPEIDLSRHDLSGAYFRGAFLRGSNLRRCNLQNTYFTKANLQDADISAADLETTVFDQANLKGARFHGSLFSSYTSFHQTNATKAHFQGCDISHVLDLKNLEIQV
jgi:uncharacterized protein YjbI with pentapeptide repeats